MSNYKKKQNFIESETSKFGEWIFTSNYSSKDSPNRVQLLTEMESRYPGIKNYILNNSDIPEEQIYKQTNKKLTDIASGYFELLSEKKFSKLNNIKPVSEDFFDKYGESIVVDQRDEQGNIVYEDVAVLDDYGEKIGVVKMPAKTERFILSGFELKDLQDMVNNLVEESVERSYTEPQEETLTQNNTSNVDIDKLVFEKVKELVTTGKLEYTGQDGKTDSIDFGKDVNRLITKGTLSSEFESSLNKFIDSLGVVKETTPIQLTKQGMVNGVLTPIVETLNLTKYNIKGGQIVHNGVDMRSFAKALVLETGGKNPDGTDVQLFPAWQDKIRDFYKGSVDEWLQKENITTFDSDAKNKFITFFNQLVETSKSTIQKDYGNIKALQNITNWNYFPLTSESDSTIQNKPISRVDDALQKQYYQPKIDYYQDTQNQNQSQLTPQINIAQPALQQQTVAGQLEGSTDVDEFLNEMFGNE
jgi:hypothetical protein